MKFPKGNKDKKQKSQRYIKSGATIQFDLTGYARTEVGSFCFCGYLTQPWMEFM